MRNIALFLTYEGTAYHGWQMQKNLPTVQETMEKAIAMVVGHSVHVTGCGRTDAGVHAKCYVANFRTSSTIPVDRLPYALNTHLPVDIVVTKAFEVHEDFNAIGSCARKEYTYIIYNSRVRDPFYVNRAWFFPSTWMRRLCSRRPPSLWAPTILLLSEAWARMLNLRSAPYIIMMWSGREI